VEPYKVDGSLDAIVGITTVSGFEIELHGKREALTLSTTQDPDTSFDVCVRDGEIIVDGFNLREMISFFVGNCANAYKEVA
jgi:hypothetical protein